MAQVPKGGCGAIRVRRTGFRTLPRCRGSCASAGRDGSAGPPLAGPHGHHPACRPHRPRPYRPAGVRRDPAELPLGRDQPGQGADRRRRQGRSADGGGGALARGSDRGGRLRLASATELQGRATVSPSSGWPSARAAVRPGAAALVDRGRRARRRPSPSGCPTNSCIPTTGCHSRRRPAAFRSARMASTAGFTSEEALRRALCELIERDAVGLWHQRLHGGTCRPAASRRTGFE